VKDILRWRLTRDSPSPALISAEERATAEIVQDFSARRKEARLEALVGSFDQIVFEMDVDGAFLNIWTTDESLLYLPRHKLLGRRSSEFFTAESDKPFREAFQRVLSSGLGEDIEYAMDVPAGKKWFLARVNRIPSQDGSENTICLVIRDITDRKRAEEKLRCSEEKFSKAFRWSPDAIVISRIETGKIIDVNDAFLRLVGYSRDEVLDNSSVDLGIWFNPREYEQLTALLKRQGEIREIDFRIQAKSGDIRTLQISAHAMDINEEPCLIAVLRDVTERRALEEQLRQAQKMEAVGRLAGGVAHDFNNLLVGILGYSDLLKRKLPEDNPQQRMAGEIHAAALRARDLTSRLLAMSRRQVLHPCVLDFAFLVRQAERLLRPIIGEDIRVELRLDPQTGYVEADPAQLEQVILNLALNARDAMPRGGVLSLETCNIVVDAAMARQHPGLLPGAYVRLWVADTGQGMSPEVMTRIFEPFFTTKESGKGSGLGLSTVYGIVKQSGGCITVTSESGRGAAFGVYLPAVRQLRERLPASTARTEPRSGNETVLLVEDEPVVSRLTSDLLEEAGYRILCSPSGADALLLLESHSGPIDLLITDVVMPEMTGPDLAGRVRKSRPHTRVLYMSGYTDDEILCRKGLPENSSFIQKPFTPLEFVRKVRETLDAPRQLLH